MAVCYLGHNRDNSWRVGHSERRLELVHMAQGKVKSIELHFGRSGNFDLVLLCERL